MREELDGVLDRRQRVPKFVPQHRQEFVLPMIGLDQFFRPLMQFVLQSPPLRDISKDQDDSLDAPCLLRIGAAETSIGSSAPLLLREPFGWRSRRYHGSARPC